MNFIKKYGSLLIIGLVIFSCQNNRKYDQTQIFSNYLQKEFNIKHHNSVEYYFIVPSTSCDGCKYSVFDFCSKKNENNYFLITTPTHLNSIQSFNLGDNLLLDKNSTIDRLNLDVANTSLIVWKDNKIQSVLSLTPNKTDSIFLSAN